MERFKRKSRGNATCMRQVEFVEQLDHTCLETTQGEISRSSSITRWIGSPPERSQSLVYIPFPRTLRSMQSFLGILNYCSGFIEDSAIYAFVLYELREADFHEIHLMDKTESPTLNRKKVDDRKGRGESNPDRTSVTDGGLKADERIVKVIAIQILPVLQWAIEKLITERSR